MNDLEISSNTTLSVISLISEAKSSGVCVFLIQSSTLRSLSQLSWCLRNPDMGRVHEMAPSETSSMATFITSCHVQQALFSCWPRLGGLIPGPQANKNWTNGILATSCFSTRSKSLVIVIYKPSISAYRLEPQAHLSMYIGWPTCLLYDYI